MNLSETIERKFVESYDVSDYEIWTDTGWEDISHTNKTIKYQVYKIILENGMFLECADDHIIFDDNMNEIFVKDCIPNKTFITTEQGASKVKEIIITDEYEHMYDISVNSDNHRYYTNGILSHNTTIMAAYLVWYVLFPDEPKNVAILANKEVQAIEIMDRIKLIYENLPQWIQQGVKVYNKKSIELENMCRIFCASTSSSAIRGKSVNCISGDSLINVKINDKVMEITVKELENILANSSRYINNNTSERSHTLEQRIEVLTAEGYKSFRGLKKTKNLKTIKITLENGFNIICTPDHKIFTNNGWIEAKNIINNKVKTENDYFNVIEIYDNGYTDVYDLLNVEDVHSFYANGILVHNCIYLDEFAFVPNNVQENFYTSTLPTISSGDTTKIIITSTPNGFNLFYKIWDASEKGENNYVRTDIHYSEQPGRDEAWAQEQIKLIGQEKFNQEYNTAFLGSSATLINPTDIGRITTIEPIRISSDTYLKTFKEPIDNHTYAMTVDVSEGVGGDYIAVTVTDITSMPYEVVSTYRNNKLDPLMLPDILNVLGRYYNFAHILVETNGIGKQVVNQLFYDLEYENLISSLYNKDNQITQGKQAELGVKTTKSTKRLGMTALKSLVESKQLILNDYQFKYELSRFIKKKDSYAAEDGETDDMVMSVVLLAWLTLQNYFTDLTDIDTKRKIRENALEELQSHVNMFIPIESNENHVYLNTNGEHINMTHFTTITSFEDWLNE